MEILFILARFKTWKEIPYRYEISGKKTFVLKKVILEGTFFSWLVSLGQANTSLIMVLYNSKPNRLCHSNEVMNECQL